MPLRDQEIRTRQAREFNGHSKPFNHAERPQYHDSQEMSMRFTGRHTPHNHTDYNRDDGQRFSYLKENHHEFREDTQEMSHGYHKYGSRGNNWHQPSFKEARTLLQQQHANITNQSTDQVAGAREHEPENYLGLYNEIDLLERRSFARRPHELGQGRQRWNYQKVPLVFSPLPLCNNQVTIEGELCIS